VSNVSPIFALDAEEMFLAGNKDEAIELCEAGVSEYPEYLAGYLLLIRLLLDANHIDRAKSYAKTALSLFSNNKIIEKYSVQIEDILFIEPEASDISINPDDISDEEIPSFEELEGFSDSDDSIESQPLISFAPDELGDESDATAEQLSIPAPTQKLRKGFMRLLANRRTTHNEDYSIKASDREIISGLFDYPFYDLDPHIESDELEFVSSYDLNAAISKYEKKKVSHDAFAELADKIKFIKIQPSEQEHLPEELPEECGAEEFAAPNTETMASIFIAQGAYSKAIDIYKELSAANPEKSSFYEQKIIELEEKVISTLK